MGVGVLFIDVIGWFGVVFDLMGDFDFVGIVFGQDWDFGELVLWVGCGFGEDYVFYVGVV